MTARTYGRLINSLAALGVVAGLLYDRAGPFSWVLLLVALLCAAAAAIAYFSFQWRQKPDEVVSAAEAHEQQMVVLGDANVVSNRAVVDVKHYVSARENSAVLTGDGYTHHHHHHQHPQHRYRGVFTAVPFDTREFGALLAEMERHNWNLSGGTLRFESPTEVAALNVVFKDRSIRLIPVYSGQTNAQKPPLSKAAPIRMIRRS